MPAQQQDARKNYIGIVNERVAEQRTVESPAKSAYFLRDYFLALIAAALKRRSETRS